MVAVCARSHISKATSSTDARKSALLTTDSAGSPRSGTGLAVKVGKPARPAPRALPKGKPLSDSGQPGGGLGRVDLTGIVPEGIRVDPNITEGHPGYDESGDSEIIPPERVGGAA